jgi:hypothetical protein
VKLGRREAVALARGADVVVAARGKKVVRMRPASVSDAELAAAILGPSGTLRAPAIRIGRTLLIGFNDVELAAALG